MAKRKGAVNDIIYELDNDDIVLSSDDEVTKAKVTRENNSSGTNVSQCDSSSQDSVKEVIDIDSSLDISGTLTSAAIVENGGKSLDDSVVCVEDVATEDQDCTANDGDDQKQATIGTIINKTTIFNEDIAIDSPCNSDLGVVGCENRTPLITVRFKDSKLAARCKKKVKAFMLELIKLSRNDCLDSENETDLEIDIWPEDLTEDITAEPETEDMGLFFVDTAPQQGFRHNVPNYNSAKDDSCLVNEIIEVPKSPVPHVRRGPTCFNCDGDHPLRDCKERRNQSRIMEMRNKQEKRKRERYHIDDEQRFGHLRPGRISGKLRGALGLQRNAIPIHIYRMRMLGYPPGWLEDARISHSGLVLYDSSGRATQDPDEEEGQVCEPGSKDKFDIKKIHDFPGFNVPISKRYKDESKTLDLPPISEQDSKLTMLQILAPNAMKAYKRKKLTFFPTTSAETSHAGPSEMDLDSGDETATFPSVPPLPDEAPPPPPPPPACPPPLPPGPPPEDLDDSERIHISDFIVLDEEGESETNSGRGSPSLDDLEVKKMLLLDALSTDNSQEDVAIQPEDSNETKKTDDAKPDDDNTQITDETTLNSESTVHPADSIVTDHSLTQSDLHTETGTEPKDISDSEPTSSMQTKLNKDRPDNTPDPKPIHIRGTEYGTPIINCASPFTKLPTDDKFAKDICDVINFENLPDSTGKYKQISTLLKRVKNEVDRIQDS